jgi:hypothetical protein
MLPLPLVSSSRAGLVSVSEKSEQVTIAAEKGQLSFLFRRLFASRLLAKYRCAAKSSNPTTIITPKIAIPCKKIYLVGRTIAAVRPTVNTT